MGWGAVGPGGRWSGGPLAAASRRRVPVTATPGLSAPQGQPRPAPAPPGCTPEPPGSPSPVHGAVAVAVPVPLRSVPAAPGPFLRRGRRPEARALAPRCHARAGSCSGRMRAQLCARRSAGPARKLRHGAAPPCTCGGREGGGQGGRAVVMVMVMVMAVISSCLQAARRNPQQSSSPEPPRLNKPPPCFPRDAAPSPRPSIAFCLSGRDVLTIRGHRERSWLPPGPALAI